MELLPTVEVEPTGPVSAAVIWLHGLGADGHDFEPIAPQLGLGSNVRFVFPHAPVRPVTVNAGMSMRAWYDVRSTDIAGEDDAAGLRESESASRALIDREVERGVPVGRIILAGFSQGGAVALHTALRLAEPLAGVVALSTYLPLASALDHEAASRSSETPVFVAHGESDPVIPVAAGRATRDALRDRGHHVEWHEYAMAHGVCAEEITDLAVWLKGRVG